MVCVVAGVAELADARDSKSRSARSVGSIPTAGRFICFRKSLVTEYRLVGNIWFSKGWDLASIE